MNTSKRLNFIPGFKLYNILIIINKHIHLLKPITAIMFDYNKFRYKKLSVKYITKNMFCPDLII